MCEGAVESASSLEEQQHKDKVTSSLQKLTNHVRGRYKVSDPNTTWYTDWISRENFCAVLVVDAASRAILGSVVYAKAPTGAEFLRLIQDLFSTYGKPSKLHADTGGAYVSKVLREYLQSVGVVLSSGVKHTGTFENQVMERVNKTIVRYLEIEHKNNEGRKAFNERNLHDKTWLVKAVVAHYNAVPPSVAKLASPMELYEWLVSQPVRFDIETTSSSEEAAMVDLWHDVGRLSVAIDKETKALRSKGHTEILELQQLMGGFSINPSIDANSLRTIVTSLKDFFNGLMASQARIAELAEAQTRAAEVRHADTLKKQDELMALQERLLKAQEDHRKELAERDARFANFLAELEAERAAKKASKKKSKKV